MDKAVIIGVYEFLGFHFCHHLLNAGIEVRGVHIDRKGEDDLFLEEKRLEIGRNANFHEHSGQDALRDEDLNNSAIIIDYYDYFISETESKLFKFPPVKRLLKCTDLQSSFILLLPIQFLADNRFEKERAEAEQFFRQISPEGGILKKYYLPTIYGPWQTGKFIFQQYFLNGDEKEHRLTIHEREWRRDAIHVEEAVQTIWENTFQEDKNETIILVSGRNNQWQECAEHLSLPIEKKENQDPVEHREELLIIKEHPPIESTLQRQKMHAQRLKLFM